nr:hypothetical protein [Tanacetum cinerariifolium]
MVVEEEGPTWMTPIQNYLEKGMLPEDPVDARTLMEKIRNYTMKDGFMYRKYYLVPLMRQVMAKAMNLGYYWPSMYRDARELIRACDDCQAHASVRRLPKADMISVTSTWPFMKFGILATIIIDNKTQFVNDPFKKLNVKSIRSRISDSHLLKIEARVDDGQNHEHGRVLNLGKS